MVEIISYSDEAKDVSFIEKECFSVPWSYDSVSEFYSSEYAFAFIAEEDGKAVGYIGGKISLDEGEIENLAVIPGYRKKGIGEMLLSRILSEFQSRGAKKIFLEVRESNLPATCLYAKKGFKKISVRKNYYSHPTENAMIMCFEF